ncbi:hypothetical protein BDZ91DRAFT_316028 [Kalaharituber pfeilii]|nr:hypothetical protein BDZ91DRAFT_316028 [Kalaharituber pfeilii]
MILCCVYRATARPTAAFRVHIRYPPKYLGRQLMALQLRRRHVPCRVPEVSKPGSLNGFQQDRAVRSRSVVQNKGPAVTAAPPEGIEGNGGASPRDGELDNPTGKPAHPETTASLTPTPIRIGSRPPAQPLYTAGCETYE